MYLNDWKDSGLEEMKSDFRVADAPLAGATILFANYEYANYSGAAFVLFERDGKLYEVNGGHCSCYGLERQWDPEETTVEALLHRIEEGYLGGGRHYSSAFADELRAVLNAWASTIAKATGRAS